MRQQQETQMPLNCQEQQEEQWKPLFCQPDGETGLHLSKDMGLGKNLQ